MYITTHADEPLSIGDIAMACGLSARTLHRSFIREHRTTPMQFLKRRRLERIRADLLAAVPGATVTRTAFHRGVTHLGRFAREYSAAFGESPSETLRRSTSVGLARGVNPARPGTSAGAQAAAL